MPFFPLQLHYLSEKFVFFEILKKEEKKKEVEIKQTLCAMIRESANEQKENNKSVCRLLQKGEGKKKKWWLHNA
jgi:hypothetical protein